MPSYEIRLRKRQGGTCAYRANRTSDFAAVRMAQSIADNGDVIEVWKGMECIYASDQVSKAFSLTAGNLFIPVR